MAVHCFSRSVKSAVAALFLFLSVLGLAEASADEINFPSELLTVISAGGTKHQFLVELATSDEQRSRGLMFRKHLDADAGMLFDFGVTRRVSMWMMNTEIPLDMLFIGEGGAIHCIHREAEPMSQAIIDSRGPVKYVLEINGGRAAALGIREGDRVISRQIGNDR